MPDTRPVSSVPDLDAVASQRWRHRPMGSSPWLHEEIAGRMIDRLDWIRQVPEQWVHWSPMQGGLTAHRQLVQRYPQAQAWVAGDRPDAAARVLTDAERDTTSIWGRLASRWRRPSAPVLDEQAIGLADMVWANMALHLHPEPAKLLARWRDLLKVGGFAMFSGLGPDTLRELRDVHQAMGWPAPHHPLTDMHDRGDMMVESGLAEPVVDMERITLTYPNAERLLADLRAWGRNLHAGRYPSCRGRGFQRAWREAVDRWMPRTADGQLQVTVEVVYGHAFKPEPRVRLAPTSQVSLDEMKALLKRPKPDA